MKKEYDFSKGIRGKCLKCKSNMIKETQTKPTTIYPPKLSTVYGWWICENADCDYVIEWKEWVWGVER